MTPTLLGLALDGFCEKCYDFSSDDRSQRKLLLSSSPSAMPYKHFSQVQSRVAINPTKKVIDPKHSKPSVYIFAQSVYDFSKSEIFPLAFAIITLAILQRSQSRWKQISRVGENRSVKECLAFFAVK